MSLCPCLCAYDGVVWLRRPPELGVLNQTSALALVCSLCCNTCARASACAVHLAEVVSIVIGHSASLVQRFHYSALNRFLARVVLHSLIMYYRPVSK